MEPEREKEQLEDDLLACLGKIDQMQKKIGEMTLNQTEFIAKVMKECDRVLAEKCNTRRKREKLSNARKVRAERPCDARMQSSRPCADR